MRILACFIFLLLAACSHSQPLTRDVASYPIFHDPLEFVEWIYELPAPKTVIFEDSRIRHYYYTPRLLALTAGRERCYKKTFNMDWLDFNYIVLGNDYHIENLRIKKLWQEDDMAKIQVRFQNLGEQQVLEYLLRSEGNGWMIDDIFTENGSLSQDLSIWCAN